MSGRCYVEISLPVLQKNLQVYRSNLPAEMDIMAVVKANAYGHGDKMVAKFLSDHGIRYFAVSNIDEAIHIREAGVEGKILILGYTPIDRAKELVQYNITQALLSEEYASMIVETGLPIKCQFAIDTCMRRIGLNTDDLDSCEKIIREYAKKCRT